MLTYVAKVEQHDHLWVPTRRSAAAVNCAATPNKNLGFDDGGLGLRQAADLVEQARKSFELGVRAHKFSVICQDESGSCGKNPRAILAAIDWSLLSNIEPVKPTENLHNSIDLLLVSNEWGPSLVKFTFPYAGDAATWVITVELALDIKAVRMEARYIVYR